MLIVYGARLPCSRERATMAYKRTQPNSDPLLMITIRRNDQRLQLERALSRIWHQPELLFERSVLDAFSFLVENRLGGNPVKPDIFILDLEDGSCNLAALLETARMAPGLRHLPFIALVDCDSAAMRDRTYDAGADLVVPWPRLDTRIGDIAGLVVGSWLNTEPEEEESRPAG